MIQRIQSLYLFLVPVVIAIMFFVPLATFNEGAASFTLWMSGFCFPDEMIMDPVQVWYVPLLGILTALLALAVIFLYRNRKLQVRLNRIILLLNILFIGSIFYAVDRTVNHFDITTYAYNIGAYLSLIPAILVYFAIGRIRRDEMKVRAADRLR